MSPARPGPALAALGVILAVTAVWWALALVPVAMTAPEWVERTRSACFGAAPGSLPDAGGWVLLFGQPVGMLAVLLAAWGDSLRRDLGILAARPWGGALLAGVIVVAGWAAVSVVGVVRIAQAKPMASGALDDPVPMVSVPPLSLVDQHGKAFNLRDASSGRVLVTFAFAHCETVCPTLVQGVVRARAGAGRTDIPLVVVTVDPWRDVPSRLASIASGWGLAAGDKVLGGTVSDVNAALDAWGVWRSRDSSTGEVAHSATVVLVARGGDSAVIVSGNPESLQATLRQAESGRSAREAGRR